jgi:hypothetical protein
VSKRQRVAVVDDDSALDLTPTAATLPVVKATRRPGPKDSLRIFEVERLRREQKMTIADAMWAVVGQDERLRYRRFIDVPRPRDATLISKYSALLARTSPELMIKAKQVAQAVLAGAAESAASKVAALATGDDEIADAHKARVRLDAGRTVLEAAGIAGRGNTNVQVNTAISLGDGLRALRHADHD